MPPGDLLVEKHLWNRRNTVKRYRCWDLSRANWVNLYGPLTCLSHFDPDIDTHHSSWQKVFRYPTSVTRPTGQKLPYIAFKVPLFASYIALFQGNVGIRLWPPFCWTLNRASVTIEQSLLDILGKPLETRSSNSNSWELQVSGRI